MFSTETGRAAHPQDGTWNGGGGGAGSTHFSQYCRRVYLKQWLTSGLNSLDGRIWVFL